MREAHHKMDHHLFYQIKQINFIPILSINSTREGPSSKNPENRSISQNLEGRLKK